MRPHFSLRTLLALTTLLAIVCYYWAILPTRTAQKFLDAIKANDFAAVDQCFRDPKDRYYAKLNEQYWTFQLEGELEPRSLSELLHGERRISFNLSFGGPRPLISQGGTIISTARGLQTPEQTTGGGYGFSM